MKISGFGCFGVIYEMKDIKIRKHIYILIIVISILVIIYPRYNVKDTYIMEGTRYETPIYYLNHGNKGTKVFIVGGIHGNEIAGIEVAKKIVEEKYIWANMVIIPMASIEACRLETRNPYYMMDLNRTFPGKKSGTDTEILAYEIFRVIELEKPDFVIDLHEWNRLHDEDSSLLTHGLILSSVEGKLWKSAEKVYNEYNRLNDEEVKLSLNISPPSGSLNKEISEKLGIPVLTIESNMDNSLQERIDFHIYIIENIIKNYEMDD